MVVFEVVVIGIVSGSSIRHRELKRILAKLDELQAESASFKLAASCISIMGLRTMTVKRIQISNLSLGEGPGERLRGLGLMSAGN